MSKMLSKFPGRCTACGCRFPVGAEINYVRGTGASHYLPAACAAAKAAAAAVPEAPKLDLTPMVDFLKAAQARGLKRPKLRVLHLDQQHELALGLTLVGRAPGSLSVVGELEGYIGCVRPDGVVTGQLASLPLLQVYLVQVAKDPATAAKHYAALKCLCSFCAKPLTDAGSVEVGYGPICAKHWGLPHHPQGTPELGAVTL